MSKTDGTDDENGPEQNLPDGGWFGYAGDQHGMPRAEGNEHLTPEHRAALEQAARERAASRGRHQATVIVHVYESGEAVPQVQFPKESSIDSSDRSQVNDALAKAAAALLNWS